MSAWGGRKVRRLFVAVVGLHGNLCHLCRLVTADTSDHIIPRSIGGPDELDNLLPACTPCNTRRQARPITADLRDELRRRRAHDLERERAEADLSPRFARRLLSQSASEAPRPPSFYPPEPQGKNAERIKR